MKVSIDGRAHGILANRTGGFDFECGARRLGVSFHDEDGIAAGDDAAIRTALESLRGIRESGVHAVRDPDHAPETAVDQRRRRLLFRGDRGNCDSRHHELSSGRSHVAPFIEWKRDKYCGAPKPWEMHTGRG